MMIIMMLIYITVMLVYLNVLTAGSKHLFMYNQYGKNV
jgi:hypothetical protein